MWGGACILGSATPPIPSEQSFSAPQFYGSPIFFLHCLTQNDQVRLGNTHGEGRVFRRSATRAFVTGAATDTERITWIDTGCVKSLLISYCICKLVCVWSKRWAWLVQCSAELRSLLNLRTWYRRRYYHSAGGGGGVWPRGLLTGLISKRGIWPGALTGVYLAGHRGLMTNAVREVCWWLTLTDRPTVLM